MKEVEHHQNIISYQGLSSQAENYNIRPIFMELTNVNMASTMVYQPYFDNSEMFSKGKI